MMERVTIPELQLNVETNVKFSSNRERYGSPPRRVMIGGLLEVAFDNPAKAAREGFYLEPRLARVLVDNVAGFKMLTPKGERAPRRKSRTRL